jgi:hypothetical protein
MLTSEPAPDRMEHYVIRSIGGDDGLSTFSWEKVAPAPSAAPSIKTCVKAR